jgi:hypothetical protein
MTGIGSSTTATPPASLTPTSYVLTTLQDYDASAHGINYLNGATIGFVAFGDGTATPLADAANFLNTTIRNNASTEPPKRTFERYMGSTASVVNPASIAAGTISPLDSRYGNYNAVTNKAGLAIADTAQFVVPTYFSSFAVPTAYYNTLNWVRGFTVAPDLVAANGGQPITVRSDAALGDRERHQSLRRRRLRQRPYQPCLQSGARAGLSGPAAI